MPGPCFGASYIKRGTFDTAGKKAQENKGFILKGLREGWKRTQSVNCSPYKPGDLAGPSELIEIRGPDIAVLTCNPSTGQTQMEIMGEVSSLAGPRSSKFSERPYLKN